MNQTVNRDASKHQILTSVFRLVADVKTIQIPVINDDFIQDIYFRVCRFFCSCFVLNTSI